MTPVKTWDTTWEKRNLSHVSQFFSVVQKRNSHLKPFDDEQKQKEWLQKQGFLQGDQFTDDGILSFCEHPDLQVRICITDSSEFFGIGDHAVKGAIWQMWNQLIDLLKPLWQDKRSSPYSRLGTAEVNFFDYPRDVVEEALLFSLARYSADSELRITITKQWIRFDPLVNPRPVLEKAFVTNNSLTRMHNILSRNKSLRADSSVGLEFKGNSLQIYRRNPAQTISSPSEQDLKPELNVLTSETILIPAGRFLMGSLRNASYAHQNELPQHEVTLPHYCLGRYPVTNGEYAHFVQTKGIMPPTHWGGLTPPAKIIDHPVTHVSLLGAQAYTEWLSAETGHAYRLPTEQEWEKAARGAWPDNREYVWGNEWQENACNTKEAGLGGTTAVTHYSATNTSPYGITDMLGNVWEWTASDYKPYRTDQFTTTTAGKYVVRGGCWDYEKKYAHVACRGRYNPGERKAYLGFRLAANPVYMLDETRLQKIFKERFNMSELRQLTLALGVNDQAIPQRVFVEMSTELTKYIKRHNLIGKLAETAPKQRPDIHWDEAIVPKAPT